MTDAIEILKGLKAVYEKHHHVSYSDDAIKASVELSARYIHDRKLPDKAIDVIDEVGAAQMLRKPEDRKSTIELHDIEEIVAKIARIPPKSVSKDDTELLRSIDRDLKTVVFGQDKAIDQLASAIKLARAGLARAGEADRLLPARRPDRRRQDRGDAPARASCSASS